MPADHFSAAYDAATKSISAVTCALAVILAVVIHNLIAVGILVVVLALSFAYAPRGYEISESAITVKRLIGDVRVPLENLRAVRRVTQDDLRGTVRLWGSGGLFGYYGLFRTSKLGRCTWYATNRKNLIVAIGASKTTVFSPDDVDGFLKAIREEAQLPESSSREMDEGPVELIPAAANPATLWIGLILVIFAALGVLAAILLTLRARGAV